MACAGLEETSHNLKQLINYSYKVKRDQRALYQVSSDESLKEQAKGEAHLKNKQAHHAFLCSNNRNDLSEFTIENTLTVLE